MAFETKKSYLITTPDIVEMNLVAPGFLVTGTDAFKIPFLEPGGGFKFELITTKGPGNDDIGYGQGMNKVTWVHKSPVSHMAMLQNAIKLALGGTDAALADLPGLVHVFSKDAAGTFYNFFRNPNLQDWTGAPACSTAFSLNGTKFHNGKDGRWIEWHLNGFLTDAMIQYIDSQKAAYVITGPPAGLTGGTTIALNAITGTRANVQDYGFHSGIIGADIGVLSDASVDIEIIGQDLQYNQQRTLHAKVTLSVETPQASTGQMVAASAASLTDQTVALDSIVGETMTFDNVRLRPESTGMVRGKDYVKLMAESEVPLTSFDFTTIGSPVITFNPA